MAIESELVTADVIEVSEFQDLAEAYQVYAVPKTVINDRLEFEGAQPEESFFSAVTAAVELMDETPEDPA